MKSQTLCVLGGSGFVGSHLVARLHQHGHRIKVLTRSREKHRNLSVLPWVQPVHIGALDDTTLTKAFAGCDAVINLVGILNGSEAAFTDLHAHLPERVIKACTANGIGRYLHMSALPADAVKGPSIYLKTKGQGEDTAQREGAAAGIAVTSFRPSVIFGPNDSFFNRFAGLLKLAPVMPLACADSRFAPVYILDVVEAFTRALADPQTAGQRYDLCGPEVFTLRQIVRQTADWMGVKRLIIGLPDALGRLQARTLEWVPGQPFSRDNYLSLQVDSVCGGDNGLERLGISPRSAAPIMAPHFGELAGKGDFRRFRSAARRD